MGMRVAKYAKTIVAVAMAAGTALTVAMGDDVLTATEGVTIALAVLGALGVYAVPNAKDTTVRVTGQGDAPFGR